MDSRTNIDIAVAWPPGSPNLGAPAASNSNPAYDFDVPAPRGPSKTFLPRTNPNGSPDLCDRTAANLDVSSGGWVGGWAQPWAVGVCLAWRAAGAGAAGSPGPGGGVGDGVVKGCGDWPSRC